MNISQDDLPLDDTDVEVEQDVELDDEIVESELSEDEIESDDVEQEETENDDENIARAKGWKPQEEYTGNSDDWVDAGEFNRREPLFKKISAQNNLIKQLKNATSTLAEASKRAREEGYQQAIKELKQRRHEAMREQEFEEVDALESEMNKLEERHEQEMEQLGEVFKFDDLEDEPKVKSDIAPEYTKFLQENPWFETDKVLQEASLAVGKLVREKHGILPHAKFLGLVKNEVKRRFPERFPDMSNPNKTKKAAVAGAVKPNVKSAKHTVNDLNPTQRHIMNTFVSAGILTEKEYIDSLVADGELK